MIIKKEISHYSGNSFYWIYDQEGRMVLLDPVELQELVKKAIELLSDELKIIPMGPSPIDKSLLSAIDLYRDLVARAFGVPPEELEK